MEDLFSFSPHNHIGGGSGGGTYFSTMPAGVRDTYGNRSSSSKSGNRPGARLHEWWAVRLDTDMDKRRCGEGLLGTPTWPSKAKRRWRGRRRRYDILAIVCFVSSGLALVSLIAAHMFARMSSGEEDVVQDSDLTEGRYVRADDFSGISARDLHTQTARVDESLTNCSGKQHQDVEEFPLHLFDVDQLRHGAVVIHFLVTAYMFTALAIVCDDYFMPALEIGCEVLNLSEDVAGATLMSMGGSAPELFSSLIGVFIVHNDIGVGTIVGSAVFNILCVIGLCGLVAGQVIILSRWPLIRDSTCYIISLIALYTVLRDGQICWQESLILLSLYLLYCVLMYNNPKVEKLINVICCSTPSPGSSPSSSSSLSNDVDKTRRAAKSEERVEMTPLIRERDSRSNGSVPKCNGQLPSSPSTDPVNNNRASHDKGVQVNLCDAGSSGRGGRQQVSVHDSDQEDDRNDDDEESGPTTSEPNSPFSIPKGCQARVLKLLSFPIILIFYFTIPDCRKARWERCFVMTFVMALLWIAVLTYVLVWMVTVIGSTLEIPEAIMGLTLLAAGASMPDTILSVIAARGGYGDMAISHSIGSNIFDILLGLGIPWFLQTAIIDSGSVVNIYSGAISYITILLIGSVTVAAALIAICRFHLGKPVGFLLLGMYVIFIVISILLELNILVPGVNLPPCVNG